MDSVSAHFEEKPGIEIKPRNSMNHSAKIWLRSGRGTSGGVWTKRRKHPSDMEYVSIEEHQRVVAEFQHRLAVLAASAIEATSYPESKGTNPH